MEKLIKEHDKDYNWYIDKSGIRRYVNTMDNLKRYFDSDEYKSMEKIIKEDDVYSLYSKLLVKESKENKTLLEIEQIIKDHDEDDSWYIDKIREVINKWKKNI